MRVTSITIGLPVSDAERSADWYRRLLEALAGKPERFDPVPGIIEYALPAAAWLQLMAAEQAPVLRLGVDDLAAAGMLLRARGIEIGSIREFPLSEGGSFIRLAEFADPDGNRLCLYEIKGQ